jgi:hypothetical protein
MALEGAPVEPDEILMRPTADENFVEVDFTFDESEERYDNAVRALHDIESFVELWERLQEYGAYRKVRDNTPVGR